MINLNKMLGSYEKFLPPSIFFAALTVFSITFPGNWMEIQGWLTFGKLAWTGAMVAVGLNLGLNFIQSGIDNKLYGLKTNLTWEDPQVQAEFGQLSLEKQAQISSSEEAQKEFLQEIINQNTNKNEIASKNLLMTGAFYTLLALLGSVAFIKVRAFVQLLLFVAPVSTQTAELLLTAYSYIAPVIAGFGLPYMIQAFAQAAPSSEPDSDNNSKELHIKETLAKGSKFWVDGAYLSLTFMLGGAFIYNWTAKSIYPRRQVLVDAQIPTLLKWVGPLIRRVFPGQPITKDKIMAFGFSALNVVYLLARGFFPSDARSNFRSSIKAVGALDAAKAALDNARKKVDDSQQQQPSSTPNQIDADTPEAAAQGPTTTTNRTLDI